MKWLWVFLAAIAGALAGATLLQDPGYVMVRAGDLVFESSIAATFLTLLAVLTVFCRLLYCSAPTAKPWFARQMARLEATKQNEWGLASSSSGRLCR